MSITHLDHYFVRANDLEETRAFYCDVMGLEIMPRPDFPFPGYWLGASGKVLVHMGPHGVPNSETYYLGSPASCSTRDSGVIDHIAFCASEPEAFHARFERLGIPARKRFFSQFGLFQMFVDDPNGLTIEINFFGISEMPLWGEDSENYADMARADSSG